MQRDPRDPKDPHSIDEGTDTYDTIDWLLKNIPNNNGRAGDAGISYGGWLTAMALIEPHPALKAVSEQASPADMFLGDDFHHNGAFRLSYGFEYAAEMETDKTNFQFRVRSVRHVRLVSRPRPALECQRDLSARQDSHLEQLRHASKLRRVLGQASLLAAISRISPCKSRTSTSPAGGTRKISTARSESTSCSNPTTRNTITMSRSVRGIMAAGHVQPATSSATSISAATHPNIFARRFRHRGSRTG